MSTPAVAWALTVRGVCPAKKTILFVLAEHHNKERGDCFPSQETIADEACMKERAARKHIKELEEQGLIERKQKFWNNRKHTFYILCFSVTHPQVQNEVDTTDDDDKPAQNAGYSEDDKPAQSADKPADIDQVTGTGVPGNRKEPESLDTREAPDDSSGRSSASRAGAKSDAPGLDVGVPAGLEGLASAINKRAPGKAAVYLEGAKLIQSNKDDETVVVVSAIWETRVSDHGRHYLKAQGWKVKAA